MKLPEGFPWNSMEEFEADVETVLTRMKEEGLRKGLLTRRADGCLVGKGHPDNWFDNVCNEEDASYQKTSCANN